MKRLVDIEKALKSPETIRNVAIVAHIDHGKTTFCDSLLAAAGLLSEELAGKVLALDFRDDERERGITIDASVATLLWKGKDRSYAVNLIDTPGHIDFTADVARSLRIADGCIVIVDAVEGVMPQTVTVLKQALKEKVKPMLFINKVDRLMSELRLNPNQMKEKIDAILSEANSIIAATESAWRVKAEDDSFMIGSASDGWALCASDIKGNRISFSEIASCYEREQQDLLKIKIPLADRVFSSIVACLPDPRTAQGYRVQAIWKGSQNSGLAHSMKSCDPKGNSSFNVTRIYTDKNGNRFYVGRVFSGALSPGQRVYANNESSYTVIGSIYLFFGQRKESIASAQAGCIIGITGLKGVQSGETLTDGPEGIFEDIKSGAEPIILRTIEPMRTRDAEKLLEALQELRMEDPSFNYEINEESGEINVTGIGELQLEIMENRIKKEKGIDVLLGKPSVILKETVGTRTSRSFTLSENPRIAVEMECEPMSEKELELGNNLLMFQGTEKTDLNHKQITSALRAAFVIATSSGPATGSRMHAVKCKITSISANKGIDVSRLLPQAVVSFRSLISASEPNILRPRETIDVEVPSQMIGEVSRIILSRRGEILNVLTLGTHSVVKASLNLDRAFGLASDIRSATNGKASIAIERIDYAREPAQKTKK